MTTMNKTRVGSLVLFLAGAYGLILSLQLPMGKWNAPGAGAFPLIVSILLTISGIGIFVFAREKVEINWRELAKEQWTPFQIVSTTAAFILALDKLGYLLASTLYVFALLFWVSRYKVWVAIGLSILIGLGSWYVFGRLFGTPLPEGILSF
jgi:putative tricarboxylic transport membrane protein